MVIVSMEAARQICLNPFFAGQVAEWEGVAEVLAAVMIVLHGLALIAGINWAVRICRRGLIV